MTPTNSLQYTPKHSPFRYHLRFPNILPGIYQYSMLLLSSTPLYTILMPSITPGFHMIIPPNTPLTHSRILPTLPSSTISYGIPPRGPFILLPELPFSVNFRNKANIQNSGYEAFITKYPPNTTKHRWTIQHGSRACAHAAKLRRRHNTAAHSLVGKQHIVSYTNTYLHNADAIYINDTWVSSCIPIFPEHFAQLAPPRPHGPPLRYRTRPEPTGRPAPLTAGRWPPCRLAPPRVTCHVSGVCLLTSVGWASYLSAICSYGL